MACSLVGAKILQKDVGKGPIGKASGLAWIHGTLCVCAHHPAVGMSWGSMGPHSELFFFLIKKEPVALTKAVSFDNFDSAETLAQGVCADCSAPFGSRR